MTDGTPNYPPPTPGPPAGGQYYYPTPGLAYAAPPPRGFSITSMVLGLVSIFFGFTFLVPIGAVIFGIIGLKREPAGKGMAITGIVIGAAFMLLWVALGALVFSIFGAILGGVATTVPNA